ncbi:hypothetical protein, partial [Acidisphaera rubrifaciens]|uniref:hypothetical protein n=1 Tax=Acidisphaera rubrifaciens TaxID=50715 RepID=UPI0006620298
MADVVDHGTAATHAGPVAPVASTEASTEASTPGSATQTDAVAVLRGQVTELARNGVTGAAMGYAGGLCMAAGLAFTRADWRPLIGLWLLCLALPYLAHLVLARRAPGAIA